MDHKPAATEISIASEKSTAARCTWIRKVQCRLLKANLSNDALAYEALSYVWGEDNKNTPPYTITVNQQEVKVTRNLYIALLRLRLIANEQVLWVDALCINQDNFEERGHQVSLMPQIYSRASTVISWIGDDALSSTTANTAMEFLRKLCYDIGVEKEPPSRNKPGKRVPRFPEGDLQPLSERRLISFADGNLAEWHAVALLWSSTYWSRLWVVQEVLRAKHLIIQCGRGDTIKWETMFMILTCLKYTYFLDGYDYPPNASSDFDRLFPDEYKKTWHSPKCVTKLQNTPAARLGFLRMEYLAQTNKPGRKGGFDLANILVRCRWAKCSDPRDKVYGLLGITDDNGKSCIYPDYHRSVLEIYELLIHNPQLSKEDQLVRFSQVLQQLFGGLSDKYFEISQGSECHNKESSESPLLHTRGTSSGSIIVLGDSFSGYSAAIELIAEWQSLYFHRILSHEPLDRVSKPMREALSRVANDAPRALAINSPLSYAYKHYQAGEISLGFESLAGQNISTTKTQDTETIQATDLTSSLPTSSSSSGNSNPGLTTIVPTAPRWMIGTRGQIGLVPGTAKEDDLICHFRGSDVAVIVRPPTEGNLHTIVGSALILRQWDEEAVKIHEGSPETFNYSLGSRKRDFPAKPEEDEMDFWLDSTALRLLTGLPGDVRALKECLK